MSVDFHRCSKYCQVGEHISSSGNGFFLYLLVIVHPMFSCLDLAWWIVVPALSMDPLVLVVILVAAVFLRESVGVKVELADDNR